MELRTQMLANYILVDHSIFRIDKGAVGMLPANGAPGGAPVLRDLDAGWE